RTHESERAHLGDELAGNLGLLIDLGRAGEDLLRGEIVRRLARELLLFGEREVEARLGRGHRHWRTPKTRPSGSRARKYPARMSPIVAPRVRARSNVPARSDT